MGVRATSAVAGASDAYVARLARAVGAEDLSTGTLDYGVGSSRKAGSLTFAGGSNPLLLHAKGWVDP